MATQVKAQKIAELNERLNQVFAAMDAITDDDKNYDRAFAYGGGSYRTNDLRAAPQKKLNTLKAKLAKIDAKLELLDPSDDE